MYCFPRTKMLTRTRLDVARVRYLMLLYYDVQPDKDTEDEKQKRNRESTKKSAKKND